MENLMTYLTAFGLAGGAGGKAAIPMLALGVFHYTPWYELSPSYRWIASPLVLVVLGVIIVAEIVADAHPEFGRWSDVLGYLPKIIAGFIVFAAVTGQVDDSLLRLVGSGVLGGVTAGGTHWLRNRVRQPIRDVGEDAHHGVGKMVSLGETGLAAILSSTAILVPVAGIVLLGGAGAASAVVANRLGSRRVDCPYCGQPIRPGAAVCRHCRQSLLNNT